MSCILSGNTLMHKIDEVLGPAELLVLEMEKAKLRGRGKSHGST